MENNKAEILAMQGDMGYRKDRWKCPYCDSLFNRKKRFRDTELFCNNCKKKIFLEFLNNEEGGV